MPKTFGTAACMQPSTTALNEARIYLFCCRGIEEDWIGVATAEPKHSDWNSSLIISWRQVVAELQVDHSC
jgi:hypothetical protein